jgi:hypothetical protein
VYTSTDPKLLLLSVSIIVTPLYLINMKTAYRSPEGDGSYRGVISSQGNNANLRHAIVLLPSRFFFYFADSEMASSHESVDRMLFLKDSYMLKGNLNCFLFVTRCMSRSHCRRRYCRDMENPEFQRQTTISQR